MARLQKEALDRKDALDRKMNLLREVLGEKDEIIDILEKEIEMHNIDKRTTNRVHKLKLKHASLKLD